MNAKSIRTGRSFFKSSHLSFAKLAKKPCALAVKRFLFQIISGFCFFFSKDNISFVRLLSARIVFASFDVQFDKRKLTAGYFKLHRLLYFTRAVWFAHSEMNHRVGVGNKFRNS